MMVLFLGFILIFPLHVHASSPTTNAVLKFLCQVPRMLSCEDWCYIPHRKVSSKITQIDTSMELFNILVRWFPT